MIGIRNVHVPRRQMFPERVVGIVYHFASGFDGLYPDRSQVGQFDPRTIGDKFSVIDVEEVARYWVFLSRPNAEPSSFDFVSSSVTGMRRRALS